jgi:hypothetical protein
VRATAATTEELQARYSFGQSEDQMRRSAAQADVLHSQPTFERGPHHRHVYASMCPQFITGKRASGW